MTEIINYYSEIPKELSDKTVYRNPNSKKFVLLHPFRVLIVGGSGTGKTNIAVNILHYSQAFDEIHIFAKDITEPLYKFLAEEKKVTISDTLDDLPNLNDVNDKKQKCYIFDDMITESTKNQKKMAEYFIRGRKKNASCIYISQSYFDVPYLLRKNITHLLILKLNDSRDINEIIKRYNLGGSKSKINTIHAMYRNSTKKKHGFLLVNLVPDKPNEMFMNGFSQKYDFIN